MKKSNLVRNLVTVCAFIGICVAGTALAGIQYVSGSVVFGAPPANVELGALESDTQILLFRERTAYRGLENCGIGDYLLVTPDEQSLVIARSGAGDDLDGLRGPREVQKLVQTSW